MFAVTTLVLGAFALTSVKASLPVDKIYGVNIGNWLLYEPWMTPSRWTAMGGEFCNDCSACRQSEWSLSKYLGQERTNEVFQAHWSTWLTDNDVALILDAKLNTVRIPMGFWIVEDIVDRELEPYAQGGLDELIRGLTMFKNAGLHVILDNHALPGVSSAKQMFAGNCTSNVQFYNSPDDYNYKRAVTWSMVMAYLSHMHPAFKTVFSIEAINEVEQDSAKTPGYERYVESFVLGIRAIESILGVTCKGKSGLIEALRNPIAREALVKALPIIAKLSKKYNLGPHFDWDSVSKLDVAKVGAQAFDKFSFKSDKQCLYTQFMTAGWQRNKGVNPADYARGPQLYDHHVYLNFGGVAPNHTAESYMQTVCNFNTAEANIQNGNSPVYAGEWSLASGFNTTNEFLKQYGDAQKFIWNKMQGWTFWNWKVDSDVRSYPDWYQVMHWSYRDAVGAGIFTKDPAELWDPNVCDPYLKSNFTAKRHSSRRVH